MISIIIPVLNEAEAIQSALQQLQGLRAKGAELIVVDGGSQDATLGLVKSLADSVFVSKPGRAAQMNAGAQQARGDVLWFLHVDSAIPAGAEQHILRRLSVTRVWGRFDIRLSGRHWLFRVIESMMNLRTRLTGVVTGDHGMFVNRAVFAQLGGFADLALMEDVEISKRLRKISWPIAISQPIRTSSRRWETYGICKTILLMWYLRLAYFLGAKPANLAKRYG